MRVVIMPSLVVTHHVQKLFSVTLGQDIILFSCFPLVHEFYVGCCGGGCQMLYDPVQLGLYELILRSVASCRSWWAGSPLDLIRHWSSWTISSTPSLSHPIPGTIVPKSESTQTKQQQELFSTLPISLYERWVSDQPQRPVSSFLASSSSNTSTVPIE
jgi:hypothetical protein